MGAKYYTPELEEIHYGFEFEYLHPFVKAGEEPKWEKHNWGNLCATVCLTSRGIHIGGFTIKSENIRAIKHHKAILTPDPAKIFSWEDMWGFINMLVDHRHEDISTLFTERGPDGELINLPKAKDFIERINHLNNEY